MGARVGRPAAVAPALRQHRLTRARRQPAVRPAVRARGGERGLLLPQVRQGDGGRLVPALDDSGRIDGARLFGSSRLVAKRDLRAHPHVVPPQLRA
eukprot:scaffold71397_cov60-Phaeocystis_antarctica.AAC.3